jgi:hypothetical protein
MRVSSSATSPPLPAVRRGARAKAVAAVANAAAAAAGDSSSDVAADEDVNVDEDGTWAAATSLVGPSSTFAAISSFALYALWITTHCIALDNTCSTQCALVLVSLPPTPNTPLHTPTHTYDYVSCTPAATCNAVSCDPPFQRVGTSSCSSPSPGILSSPTPCRACPPDDAIPASASVGGKKGRGAGAGTGEGGVAAPASAVGAATSAAPAASASAAKEPSSKAVRVKTEQVRYHGYGLEGPSTVPWVCFFSTYT